MKKLNKKVLAVILSLILVIGIGGFMWCSEEDGPGYIVGLPPLGVSSVVPLD